MVEKIATASESVDDGIGVIYTADQQSILFDAESLFSAEFSRAGDDLLLNTTHGEEFLLRDYFAQEQPPQLETPEGARLTPGTVESLAGPEIPTAYAQAGGVQLEQSIGEVSALNGIARVQRSDGSREDLSEGDPIFQGDVVSTGVGSDLGIQFVDNTVFSLSSNARMVIDELVYNPGGTSNSMGVSLIQGTFVFVTGQVAPSGGMDVETPTGTIGIRGTTVGVQIATLGGSTRIVNLVNPETGEVGSFIFTNGGGSAQFTQANHFLQIRSASDLPGMPSVAPSGTVGDIFGRNLNNAVRIHESSDQENGDLPPSRPEDSGDQEGNVQPDVPQEIIEALLQDWPIETAAGGDQPLGGGAEFRLPPWLSQDFGLRSLVPQGVIGEVTSPELNFPGSFTFSVIFTPPAETPVAPSALFGLPGAAAGGAGILAAIKEDSSDNLAIFAAQAGGAANELTSIEIALPGFAPGDIDISQIIADLAGPPLLGTAVVATPGGVTTIVITFQDAQNVQTFGSSFTLDAPVADSDNDLAGLQITANAKSILDPSMTGTVSASGTLVLDAVLDQAGFAVQAAQPALAEAAEAQEVPLNLILDFADAGFGAAGPDIDASEAVTSVIVTLSAGELTLGAGAPAGALVTDNGGGSFALSVADPADYGAAIAALQLLVPAGLDGTIGGSISVTTAEFAPNGEEVDAADNSKTVTTEFSVALTGGSVSPSISFGDAVGGLPGEGGEGGPGDGGDGEEGPIGQFAPAFAVLAVEDPPIQILTIKEDSQGNIIPFSIGAGDATDELTAVVFELPAIAADDVDITQILTDLNGSPSIGSATVTTPGGVTTITITFNQSLDVQGFTSSFALNTPLADSDLDLSGIKVTAFAKDISNDDATGSASLEGAMVVDAVADPVTVALNVTSTTGDGTFAPGQAGTAQLLASFGDAVDGSEVHTIIVDIPEGFSVGSLDAVPAGVDAVMDVNGDVVFTLGSGGAPLDFTFEVVAPAVLTEGGNYDFTATARAEEQPGDAETDVSDNVAEESVQETVAIVLPTVTLQSLAGFTGAPALDGGSPLSSAVQEGDGAWFRLVVSQTIFSPASVMLKSNDGSATAPADFDGTSFDFFLADGTLLDSGSAVDIPAGETEVFVRVTTAADDLFEGLEDFSLEITAATNATFTADAEIAGAVSDGVVVSVDDAALSGGNAFEGPSLPGGGGLTFTVSLSEVNASGQPVVVTYTLGGAATAGVDYDTAGLTPAPGQPAGTYQVTIGAGAQSATIVLPLLDDAAVEPGPESVTVTLTGTNTAAVTLGDASGSATITDLNGTITIDDAGTVSEGGSLDFDVSLALTSGSLAPGTVVRVPLSYSGEAVAGDFIAPLPAFIDLVVDGTGLAAAATLGLATVTGDGFEGLEGLTVTAAGPFTVDPAGSATAAEGLSGAEGFGAISDGVVVSVDDAALSGGNAFEGPSLPGGDGLTFTVSLSEVNASGQPVVVTYTLGGAATAGVDYDTAGLTPAPGQPAGTYQVTIGAGAQSATIVLPLLDDAAVEPGPESVTVTLTGTNTAAVTLGDASGSATITDLNGTITIDDAGTVSEGGSLDFDVSLALTSGSLAPGTVVRVPLSYSGEAVAGDFIAPLPAFIDLVVDGTGLAAAATLGLATVTGDGFEGLEGLTVTAAGPFTVDPAGSATAAEGLSGDSGTGAIDNEIVGLVCINEIGLGIGTSPGGAENQSYIELRNIIDSAIGTSKVKSLTIQIIGADGGTTTVDLSTATGGSINIPPHGFLTVFEDGTWATSTPGGDVQQSGTYLVSAPWGFGSDTSAKAGVHVRQGDASVDMFVANGAAFPEAGAWTGAGTGTPTAAALFGALVNLQTYSGLIGDQDGLLTSLGRADIAIDEDPKVDDEGTRIFSRIFADEGAGDEGSGDPYPSDTNKSQDWTTSNFPTTFASSLNDDNHPAPGIDDLNPQDTTDDLNPAQGAGTNAADAGQTTLEADSDGDTLNGGSGQDFLFGDADSNLLRGGGHNDFLFGDAGNDRLEGGKGADLLVDVDGSDILIGNSGDDILIGGQEHLEGSVAIFNGSGDLLIGDNVVAGPIPSFNLVYAIDVSGSMSLAIDGTNPEVGEKSRLDLAKEAFLTLNQQIIDAGFAGVVNIKVVPFSGAAINSQSLEFARADDPDLAAAISGLTTSGGTQFEPPLAAAASWLLENERHLGSENFILVLSDGVDSNGYNPSASLFADLYDHGPNGTVPPEISNLTIEAFGFGSGSTFSADQLGEVETGAIGNGGQVTVVDDVSKVDLIFSRLFPSDESFGEDVILGGSGDDYIFGDTLLVDPDFDGSDLAYVELVLFGEGPDAEGARLAIGTFGESDWIEGGEGNDSILGQGGDDMIVGGAGSDLLHGGSGDDTLDGGTGPDTIHDGTGSDLIRGGIGTDRIFLLGDGETDTVAFSDAADAGDTVTGFDTSAPNAGGDLISLSDLLDTGTFSGTTLSEAIAQGYVDLFQDGANVDIFVDLDGSAAGSDPFDGIQIVTFENVSVASLSDNIVVD
ncbi:Calx-beta domain-containing protein [Pelagibius sp. 7325]|uniref:Calx-beta domain-containing protein n=1 Tax=Pelagibius sp. 7325 TaxID=3131994 RepID=UPI0030ED0B5D